MINVTKILAVLLMATVLVGLSTAPAEAGNFSLDAEVVAAFDLVFNPIALPDISTFPGFAAIYQVDYTVTTSTPPAGELGFASVAFSLETTGVLGDDFALGWNGTPETVDTNGAFPGGSAPLFATNLDAGAPGDLVGILTAIAGGLTTSSPTDDRILVGQAPNGPRLIGSVFMVWDGLSLATLTTADVAFVANSDQGVFLPSTSGQSTTVEFGVIPEPATLALGLMGLFGLASLRRRGC